MGHAPFIKRPAGLGRIERFHPHLLLAHRQRRTLAARAAARATPKQELDRARGEAGAYATAAETELAAKLEAEREKRVEHLQNVAARRIGKMGLARGWSGWQEMWAEKVRQRSQLKAAGGRLLRPKLAASLGHWKSDWAAEVAAAIERGKRQLAADAAARQSSEANLALTALRAERDAARAEVAKQREAYEKLEEEYGLGKSEAEKDMARRLEAEREKRVEHVHAKRK